MDTKINMLIKEIRIKLNLSQREFSERFDVPISTLRKWEQGESSPSKYLINLFLMTLPEFQKDTVSIGSGKNKYFINNNLKIVYDRFGNSIKYSGDIDEVNKNNLLIYLEYCFEAYYEAQKNLNISIKRDRIDNIVWEKSNDWK